ncbi:MAG TPA: type II toxin-antitoxin system PemK/MazF family toxin [Chloroflexia bacterium]
MTKGKVVLVPFPFDDLSASKVRPAICLTEPIGPYRHVVMAFLTSSIPNPLLATDIAVNISQSDAIEMGLHVSSTIRLHRLLTLSKSVILRELGSLSPRMQEEVSEKLRQLFDL